MRKRKPRSAPIEKETKTSTAELRFPRALARASGLDLGEFRAEHVAERIRRALRREHVAGVDALARLLRADAEARLRFRRSVAVPVTGLFRDQAQFDLIDREVLPALVASGRSIRVWSAGCADGSELYSVAVLLERHGALGRARLLGSDLLEENVAVAARGAFEGVVLEDALRARVRFERRDLVREGAPAGTWDLVLCRNVAIYLEASARARLHDTLASALAPGGTLVLGRSERLSRPRELGLEPIGPHAYRRPA